jgi:hypothetical protein
MPWLGFEPTIPVFERAKTVHTVDRAVAVIGSCNNDMIMTTNPIFDLRFSSPSLWRVLFSGRRLGGTCRLHLYGQRVNQEINQQTPATSWYLEWYCHVFMAPWLIIMGSGLDDWIYWRLLCTVSLNYKQHSAITDLHSLQFTVTHALGFSVFTNRILETEWKQSHCD